MRTAPSDRVVRLDSRRATVLASESTSLRCSRDCASFHVYLPWIVLRVSVRRKAARPGFLSVSCRSGQIIVQAPTDRRVRCCARQGALQRHALALLARSSSIQHTGNDRTCMIADALKIVRRMYEIQTCAFFLTKNKDAPKQEQELKLRTDYIMGWV